MEVADSDLPQWDAPAVPVYPAEAYYAAANSDYAELVDRVLTNGTEVQSRFGPCKEMFSQQLTFPAGWIPDRAGMNLRIGWVEVVQLLAGIHDPGAYAKYAPSSTRSLFTAEMAYGPRTAGYWQRAVDTLREDPDNRQVVVPIANSRTELGTPAHPCTIALQFLLRRGVLRCEAFMRSWDLVKGTTYDVMMFGAATQAVAMCMGATPGTVTITAGSTHAYAEDIHAGKLPRLPGKVRGFELRNPRPSAPQVNWPAWREWGEREAAWNWEKTPGGITVTEFMARG